MKIAALTRYKQGDLWMAIRRLGWTQAELARRCGWAHPTRIGEIINLHRRPREAEAIRIQNALAEGGEYVDIMAMWPEHFTGLKCTTIEDVRDVEFETLLAAGPVLALSDSDSAQQQALFENLDRAVATLKPQEREVLQRVVCEGKTLDRVGRKLKVSRERVRQIKVDALRKLRHPERMRIITGEKTA